MSRTSFAERLSRIGQRRRPTDSAPKPAPRRRADPMADDEDAPIWTDLMLLVVLAAMAGWLMFDFWRALPFVIVAALVLGGYSLFRELYLSATGARRHRRRSPLWGFFEDLWH